MFFNVPVIVLTETVCDNPPVKPEPVGVDQLYNVPAGMIPFTPLVGVTLKLTPLQVMVVIVFTDAAGVMVTVTVNGRLFPQLVVIGVTK